MDRYTKPMRPSKNQTLEQCVSKSFRRGMEKRKLARLITWRSAVRIRLPQPNNALVMELVDIAVLEAADASRESSSLS